MPTPEENLRSVRTFAEEVIGNKNLKLRTTGSLTISSNIKCSCRHARQEGCDSYRIFFAASPDMTVDIHDMVAACGKVAIRATYRGTDKGGFIPGMPATGKPSKWRPCTWSGSTTRDRSSSIGVSSTPSERWDSSACFRLKGERRRRSGRPPWSV
jgi:predicted ester cyclase